MGHRLERWVLCLAALALAAASLGYPAAAADEKDKPKEPLAPPAPALKWKTGEPIHDAIVEFEHAYADSQSLFTVDEFTKHDYPACQKAAGAMSAAFEKMVKLHDDRLRQFGNDYHHKLEAVVKTLKQLAAAVHEHNRTDIFTYYAQLKTQRDALAFTAPWEPKTPGVEAIPVPEGEKDKK